MVAAGTGRRLALAGPTAPRGGVRHACGGVLVVYSLSRLARNTTETLELGERLAKAGADLVSLSEKIDTTSAAGKMVFRMLAARAQCSLLVRSSP